MWSIKRVYSNNQDYEKWLGLGADAYVHSLEWLFSDNALDEYYLRGIMTMPDFISGVYFFIKAANEKLPKQTIRDYISRMRSGNTADDYLMPMNKVIHETIKGDPCITFFKMDRDVIAVTLWSAYIFWLFNYGVDREESSKKAASVLLDVFAEESGLLKKYINDHPLMKQTEKTLDTISNYMNDEMKKEDNPIEENKVNLEEKLLQFKSDAIYGQCYEGIIQEVAYSARTTDGNSLLADCVKVYEEAQKGVKKVLDSSFPEIEIPAFHSQILKEYCNRESNNGNLKVSVVTRERLLGTLIEMTFIVVLWDKMENKSQLILNAFNDFRSFVENLDYSRPYTSNPLWKLIGERIPASKQPLKEDLLVEIDRLNNVIAEKDRIISQKDEEYRLLEMGYKQEEGQLTSYASKERITTLLFLLDLPDSLEGDLRTQAKDYFKFMTKAADNTLETWLSQNSLKKMKEDLESILQKYPILNRHSDTNQ